MNRFFFSLLFLSCICEIHCSGLLATTMYWYMQYTATFIWNWSTDAINWWTDTINTTLFNSYLTVLWSNEMVHASRLTTMCIFIFIRLWLTLRMYCVLCNAYKHEYIFCCYWAPNVWALIVYRKHENCVFFLYFFF